MGGQPASNPLPQCTAYVSKAALAALKRELPLHPADIASQRAHVRPTTPKTGLYCVVTATHIWPTP
jgi:hypothetical protein